MMEPIDEFLARNPSMEEVRNYLKWMSEDHEELKQKFYDLTVEYESLTNIIEDEK